MTTLPAQHRQMVRERIRDDATLDAPYMLMNILAAAIASYGLLANSPAVVIGAMIVAMLLGPIIALGLAVAESDARLSRKSVVTLLAGGLGIIATAFIVGLVHRTAPITNEIMARTAPNLFDLMIALAGGAAGAYATVSPRLSIAFVGVAIATALVPPLSTASILMARGEMHLVLGALLLAFTNIVAIQFACAVVLWVSGFRGVSHTSRLGLFIFVRRNVLGIVIMLVLAGVLTINLQRAIARELYETSTRFALQQAINASAGSHMAEVRFETTPTTTIVRAVVRGPSPPSAVQVAAMEAKLPPPPDRTKLELRLRFVETMILNRDGRLFTDVEFAKEKE